MTNPPPPPPPTPPAGRPVPPAAPTASTSAALPLGVIAALLTVISLPLAWTSAELWDKERTALELTSQIVWDDTPADLGSFPLAIPLGVVAVAMLMGALKANLRALLVIGSIVALLIPLLYINTTSSLIDRYNPSLSTLSTVGVGTWACLFGAVLGVIAAIAARKNAAGAPAAAA